MGKEHIGARLRALMDRAKITNTQLAEACGVTVQAVSKWISKGQIARERVAAICAALDVTADDLLGPEADAVDGEERGLPSGRYVFIKRHKVSLPHGEGESDRFEEVDDEVAFRADFLKRNGWTRGALAVFYARGYSMAPRIQPRDVLLLDTSERGKRIEHDKVYAIRYAKERPGVDREQVKRLLWRYDGALIIHSDNTGSEYKDEVIPESELDSITTIGRVVWVGGGM